jgi:hypothetical protein
VELNFINNVRFKPGAPTLSGSNAFLLSYHRHAISIIRRVHTAGNKTCEIPLLCGDI